jgi:hypothetical protein
MQPPGRITRKTRDFEAEIVQLRAQGYTLEAIRQALAGAGVHVSINTVRREAIRHAAPNPVAAAGAHAPGGLAAWRSSTRRIRRRKPFDMALGMAPGSSRGPPFEGRRSRADRGGDWWALQGSNLRQTD